jgi:hypothetical protein
MPSGFILLILFSRLLVTNDSCHISDIIPQIR